MSRFLLGELDRVAIAHSTFTEDALGLIVRSSEGILRRAKNICVAALLDAVRDVQGKSGSSRSTASCSSLIGGRSAKSTSPG